MLRNAPIVLAAAAIAGTGCGRQIVSPSPSPAAVDMLPPRDARRSEPPWPWYVIGELCLAKLQRQHLFPRFLVQDDRWRSEAERVRVPLVGASRRFTVLGFDGARRGTFITKPDETPVDPAGFVGGHVDYRPTDGGACSIHRDGRDIGFQACTAAGGCSLAVAMVDDSTISTTIEIPVAEACVDRGTLVADLDGDGRSEAFELTAFLSDTTAAYEVWGTQRDSDDCARGSRGFAWYETKRADAPAVDVLGIADLDADGRRELVIAIRAGTSRTVAVYQAREDGTRLDRIAVTEDSAQRF